MRNNFKKYGTLLALCLLICVLAFVSPKAEAAEAGTLVSNPIELTSGEWYTKYWTNQNCDLNCYNKIVVPDRGYITFTASKPFDDEGEICSYKLYLYNSEGELIWECNSNAQKDSFSENYEYNIGLAEGTYYMNLDPSFYVFRNSAPIETMHKYTFTQSNYWEIEPNNDLSTATVLTLEETYSAVYCEESYYSSFNDYYTFELEEGRLYEISIFNYNKLVAGTTIVDLFDPDSEEVNIYGCDKDVGNSRVWTFTANKSGMYHFLLWNDGNDAGVSYQIKVSEKTIPASELSVALSAVSFTYDGKTKKPDVKVFDSEDNELIKNTDFTVEYESGRKNPGRYTITVTFKGKYSGTATREFTIEPKVTGKITATQTTSTVTLKWNKVTGADGYTVYGYNSKTKKYKKIKSVTGTSLKLSKLSAGTIYKYKVRAYTKDGGTIWGEYSSAFETATNPKTPTLKVKSTSKGKVTFSWTNVSGESGYQVYYSTKKNSGYKKASSYKTNVVKGSKSKLKSGKKYYFKLRAYKKTASGTVYSAWSSVKSIKIK